jgi:hypothetical protein
MPQSRLHSQSILYVGPHHIIPLIVYGRVLVLLCLRWNYQRSVRTLLFRQPVWKTVEAIQVIAGDHTEDGLSTDVFFALFERTRNLLLI